MVNTIKNFLKTAVKGKIVLIGIGNDFRGDDGVGPKLIRKLKGKLKIDIIDCGEIPENYKEKIKKLNPDTLIVVDAAQIGSEPGVIKILKTEDVIQTNGFSTHSMSLNLFFECFKNIKIIFIGIQPENISFGKPISQNVKKSIDYLEKIFIELFGI